MLSSFDSWSGVRQIEKDGIKQGDFRPASKWKTTNNKEEAND